jgi:hypothetical protein
MSDTRRTRPCPKDTLLRCEDVTVRADAVAQRPAIAEERKIKNRAPEDDVDGSPEGVTCSLDARKQLSERVGGLSSVGAAGFIDRVLWPAGRRTVGLVLWSSLLKVAQASEGLRLDFPTAAHEEPASMLPVPVASPGLPAYAEIILSSRLNVGIV